MPKAGSANLVYHRRPNEDKNKDELNLQIYGVNIV